MGHYTNLSIKETISAIVSLVKTNKILSCPNVVMSSNVSHTRLNSMQRLRIHSVYHRALTKTSKKDISMTPHIASLHTPVGPQPHHISLQSTLSTFIATAAQQDTVFPQPQPAPLLAQAQVQAHTDAHDSPALSLRDSSLYSASPSHPIHP
jgi:hypothetical protein